MHKYEELEKLYYKKKYTKYALFLFSFIIVGLGGYFIFKNNVKKTESNTTTQIVKKQIEIKKEENITKKIVVKEKNITEKNKTVIVNKTVKEKPKEIKKLVLYPIFPEIDLQKEIKEVKNRKKIEKTPKIEVKKENNPKKPVLKIVVKSAKTTKDLIYLFDKSPTYSNAIRISKIYFNKENYKESIEWAKKANEINPEDYESWYVFAKSLIKLGKVNKAKKVLIAYLNTYGPDKNIEELLRSIK